MSNKADKGPPQRFDLPLADGMIHYNSVTESSYAKAGNGLVVVHFYCKKEDGSAFDGVQTIATLPIGFRPARNIHCAAMISETGDSSFTDRCCVVVCDPGGVIWLSNAPAGTKAATATIVFYSA